MNDSHAADSYYDPESREVTRYHQAWEAYLQTSDAIGEAWEAAALAMPDHLTDHILDWFETTPRFHTLLDEWIEDGADH